jgi:hypothetical protein
VCFVNLCRRETAIDRSPLIRFNTLHSSCVKLLSVRMAFSVLDFQMFGMALENCDTGIMTSAVENSRMRFF